MKYYAVTEDPNELLHYGVKGMKWGQHIFGKERSPGYRRALGKLRSAARGTRQSLRSAANAIKKSNTQRSMMKEQKRQDKYAQAVAKAQKRIQLTENLHTLDQMKSYERNTDRQYKIDHKNISKIDRAAAKRERQYAKSEAKMDKYIQQAREGKLKYGKLSDDQVQRITGRLASEKSARSLGSTEKSWRQQKKEARRQGKLQGITRGTAAAMEEVARAGTIYGIQNFMNRRKLNAVARQEGKENRIRNRQQNKKTGHDLRKELKQEAYISQLESGKNVFQRGFGTHMTVAQAARRIQRNEDANVVRLQNVESNKRALQSENDLKEKARLAYEYGFLSSGVNAGGKKGNKQNGGGQNNNGNNNSSGYVLSGKQSALTSGKKKQQSSNNQNGQNNQDAEDAYRKEVKRLADYYQQRYVDQKTVQQRAADQEAKRIATARKVAADRKKAANVVKRQQRDLDRAMAKYERSELNPRNEFEKRTNSHYTYGSTLDSNLLFSNAKGAVSYARGRRRRTSIKG